MAPQNQGSVTDAVNGANNNLVWYRDNDYPFIAQQIAEYGTSYCQYSYSLPRPLSEMFQLMMQVNYADYFTALGFTEEYYDGSKNKFNTEKIIAAINNIESNWQKKYPKFDCKTDNLKFDNMLNFNHSFTCELALLNFDSKWSFNQINQWLMPTQDIIEKYQDAIIQIATQGGTGTGFYVKEFDVIVTNNHVVDNSAEVTIQGKVFPKLLSRVWYTDRKHDLAF